MLLYYYVIYIISSPLKVVTFEKNGIILSVGGWYKIVTTIRNAKNNSPRVISKQPERPASEG